MNYQIQYEPDYGRLLPAMIIDSRSTIPAIRNQVGSVIKSYTDSKVALIGSNSIYYRIETNLGVIASTFSIDVNTSNKTAVQNIITIRPAFFQFKDEIQVIINNFITSNGWLGDYLFD
jgi:hypothetical protein